MSGKKDMNDEVKTTVNTRMLEQLDKIQRLDHDTITRLEATSNAFFLQISKDIKDVKDIVLQKNIEFELRLKNLEKVHEEVNPLDGKKKLDILWQDKSNRLFNNRFIIMVSGFFASLITIGISLLAFYLRLLPSPK
jgi:bifunctional ADP-heptose synthase (sugar kinase/adenylyltransferase)